MSKFIKKRKYKIQPGQIYLVDSFCDVKHKAKVKKPLADGDFIGCLVDNKDMISINSAGVPIESLKEEFFVFQFQIIKRINKQHYFKKK